MTRRNTQRGFTLIEIMIGVVIIGILTAIVLPVFTGEVQKTTAGSEVQNFFTELSMKEEQYKSNGNGTYLSAAACPSTAKSTKQDATGCVASGTPWYTLRVVLPEQSAACSYTITAGKGTGTTNPSGFTFKSPSTAWYYIIATCDADGASGTSTYFTSSVDSNIQVLNEGS
jgi:prepilin-type N-terminal cleavage/methylation domain-containing protein